MKYIDTEENTQNNVIGKQGAFFWSHSKNQISKAETMELARYFVQYVLGKANWKKTFPENIFLELQ